MLPKELHCYLGIQLTMDGNQKWETQLFRECNLCYVNLLQKCPLSHWKVRVVYLQCYLPMDSYPLPATSMIPKQLLLLQQGAMAAFLFKMGYPRTFPHPHATVYASSSPGGIGFCQLGWEQAYNPVSNCWNTFEQTQPLEKPTPHSYNTTSYCLAYHNLF